MDCFERDKLGLAFDSGQRSASSWSTDRADLVLSSPSRLHAGAIDAVVTSSEAILQPDVFDIFQSLLK